MELLGEILKFDEGEAKPVALHLCKEPGVCHKCSHKFKRGSLICPNCFGVNLDW